MPDSLPFIPIVDGLAALADNYEGFVLDTAGVLHDGAQLYPGALDALQHLKYRGKKVCLLTNLARRSLTAARARPRAVLPAFTW